MKRAVQLLAILAIAISSAFGQASQVTVNMQASSLSGAGGTIPVTINVNTFAITGKFELRNDNLISGGPKAYFGEGQYALPLAKALSKTNLDANSFRFYVFAGAGFADVAALRRVSETAGGGFEYSPQANGTFAITCEVGYINIPTFSKVRYGCGPRLLF